MGTSPVLRDIIKLSNQQISSAEFPSAPLRTSSSALLRTGPFDLAQDRPFGMAQDRPFGMAQDRLFGLAQDKEETWGKLSVFALWHPLEAEVESP
jgi:hypothetical protein